MGVDYFLKIGDVKGESKDKVHKEEIVLKNFNFSIVQTGRFSSSGGGGGAGKAYFTPFIFDMEVNKASPVLKLFNLNGKHIPSATLTVRKSGEVPQDYLIFEFTDLLISVSLIDLDDKKSLMPLHHIAIDFDQVKATYKEQRKDGSLMPGVSGGYNRKQNKSV